MKTANGVSSFSLTAVFCLALSGCAGDRTRDRTPQKGPALVADANDGSAGGGAEERLTSRYKLSPIEGPLITKRRAVSAVTQSVPPSVEMNGFKMYHLEGGYRAAQ